MTEILMPKLSDTMTEGLLGTWLKSVGDRVSRGDIIAEVETDKATMGLEAFSSGVLLEQRVMAGVTVPVGTVLGILGEPDEVPAGPQPSTAIPPNIAEGSVAGNTGSEGIASGQAQAQPVIQQRSREAASPIVRRRARDLGVDLGAVQGSGAEGRVLLDDLAHTVPARTGAVVSSVTEQAGSGTMPVSEAHKEGTEAFSFSRLRTAVARAVTVSWRDIPHFTVTIDIGMDTAEEIRRELKLSGKPVSINDLIIKGVALALHKFPHLNASYGEGQLIVKNDINVGIMVTVADGLIVPVIKRANFLTLAEIADTSRILIDHVHKGTIREQDITGGTFSISNLGGYGVSQFSAIILPPQVGILAVGSVTDAVVARNGAPVLSRIMKVTLSADHRAVDGVYAADFLRELRQILENPVRLLSCK